MTAVIIDAAGRKVDVRPGYLGGTPEEQQRALLGFMDENADHRRFVAVNGIIIPAISTILEAQTIDPEHVQSAIAQSILVPEGHLSLFVRGFSLGFDQDISTALHILIPQLEESLRYLLHQNGTIASSLDEVGIEESWTLGKILGEPALKSILGEPLVYDFRYLLLGQPGSNMRNLLAHGLLTEAGLSTPNAVYLWWLIWRTTVIGSPAFKAWAELEMQKSR
jgi:hypothetical protein